MRISDTLRRMAAMTMTICAIAAATSCNEDDPSPANDYTGVLVTVCTDPMLGATYFMTDNDIALYPSNMDMWPSLAKIRRAFISFRFTDGTDPKSIKPGRTYRIALGTDNGDCGEVYCYYRPIDTASDEYMTGGNDSLAVKCKSLINAFEEGQTAYIANGYLNFTPSVAFNPTRLVQMQLHYNSQTDVTESAAELKVFFNNNANNATEQAEILLSLALPETLYGSMLSQGLNDSDTVTVTVTAPVVEGLGKKSFRVPVCDLMQLN